MNAPGGGLSRKRTAFTIIGLAVSASWLTLVAIYIGDEVGWDNMVLMLPHEIGFTLFGVFAPLAFLWLLLIYFSADRRLNDATLSLERRLDQLIYPSDDAAARVEAITRALRDQARELSGASETAALEAERLKERVSDGTRGLVEAAERMATERTAPSPNEPRRLPRLPIVPRPHRVRWPTP